MVIISCDRCYFSHTRSLSNDVSQHLFISSFKHMIPMYLNIYFPDASRLRNLISVFHHYLFTSHLYKQMTKFIASQNIATIFVPVQSMLQSCKKSATIAYTRTATRSFIMENSFTIPPYHNSIIIFHALCKYRCLIVFAGKHQPLT